MSPPSSADKPPFAASQNPNEWRFKWEAQSHTPILRLLIFNSNTKPSAQCRDLKLNLLPEQFLLTVSFSSEEAQIISSVQVPVPRVLIDPESAVHIMAFEDHIEVKLVLLLPVNHPLVSDFDSILNFEENKDELPSLFVDSDLKRLSGMEEVHFYCRSCSTKLTKGLRCFEEMPSVNWRDVADDWFGSCCCSFGGIKEKEAPMNGSLTDAKSHMGNCDIGCCSSSNGANAELLENQKVFLDGFLGNGFMMRSSALSKDIEWTEFSCPHCSCLIGAYPCFEDNLPIDGGIRLFKYCISTCLPSSGLDDTFRNYTLERMFTSQLLESAEDELSFRTIVRDIQTKSPVLQIILLNPNLWSCTGCCLQPREPNAKLFMYPTAKVLFSACSHGMGTDPRTVEDWTRKNEGDEVYMFSSQIEELIRGLEVSNSLSPPSYKSLQGLFLSSIKR